MKFVKVFPHNYIEHSCDTLTGIVMYGRVSLQSVSLGIIIILLYKLIVFTHYRMIIIIVNFPNVILETVIMNNIPY